MNYIPFRPAKLFLQRHNFSFHALSASPRSNQKLRQYLTILLITLTVLPITASNSAINGLLHRILPHGNDASKFICNIQSSTSHQDYFKISCDSRNILVEGNNTISIATGINWYLQHYAGINISWNNPTARLPRQLQAIPEEIHQSSVDTRYYLNFCTHSYTMAFWDWKRWEQEIDWMALHGINLPLIITGMECVWREVLMQGYGYQALSQVNEFVTGSAYYGWFFMNNMTVWGGPQPESWYNNRKRLARQIFKRLNTYGITPVIPGYVGMVPEKFLSYAAPNLTAQWTPADIVGGGDWNAFTRPYFVNNTERLREFGQKYYAAINSVFGDVLSTHYYAIDPFHEGGVPQGVTNARQSVETMYQALIEYDRDAIWVAQHWQNNPTEIVTHTINAEKLLILDLHGESSGDTDCSGYHTTVAGEPHRWIWGMVSNFGGNIGLFGRMDRIINSFYQAVDKQASNALCGIGAIPEGIENNPILYDLLYALPWANQKRITHDSWLEDYVKMRYGVDSQRNPGTYQLLLSAWKRLANGIYNCPTDYQQGTTESVFMMRPSTQPTTVSSWAYSSWYWNLADLRRAALEMKAAAPYLRNNANFQYDFVDIVRQALADLGKQTLDSMTNQKGEQLKQTQNHFLQLLLEQDQLLGTMPHFRLGSWIEAARSLGKNSAEKTLYEKNARMLLTTWGDKPQCETGALHDYANREWNGLLAAYYYPRWKAYFEKDSSQQLSWFDNFEWPFVMGNRQSEGAKHTPANTPYSYNEFSSKPQGDPIEAATRICKLYLEHTH